MKKQVLLSIPHMRVVNILKGNIKTEAYKRIPKKFIGGWVNICDGYKIVARFKFNRYTRIPVRYTTLGKDGWTFDTKALALVTPHLIDTRIPLDTLAKYSKGQDLYLWHIDDLEVFSIPKTLDMFTKPKKVNYDDFDDWAGDITKPPQTWRFAIEKED